MSNKGKYVVILHQKRTDGISGADSTQRWVCNKDDVGREVQEVIDADTTLFLSVEVGKLALRRQPVYEKG